jgi:hypothetical protein
VSLLVLAALSIIATRTIPGIVAQVTVSPTTTTTTTKDAKEESAARVTTQALSGLLFALGLHI